MKEQLHTLDIEQRFGEIIDAERERDIESFEDNLEVLHAMPSDVEKEISSVSYGKRVGCQDTGGGGYEWSKLS